MHFVDCVVSYWTLGYSLDYLCCDRRTLIMVRWSLLLVGTFIFPILVSIHHFIKKHKLQKATRISGSETCVDDDTKIDILTYYIFSLKMGHLFTYFYL